MIFIGKKQVLEKIFFILFDYIYFVHDIYVITAP